MKINEIIVESRDQINEGVLDAIKDDISAIYQKAKQQYPDVDKVESIVKSHSDEAKHIFYELKSKKKSGKLSQQDIFSILRPLADIVSREMENIPIDDKIQNVNESKGLLGSILTVGGVFTFFLNNISSSLNSWPIFFMSIVLIILGMRYTIITADERMTRMTPRERDQEEYDRLERKYKDSRVYGNMSYAETRRMKELYDRGSR